MSKNVISRREFMKMTGIFGASMGVSALGGGLLVGCAPTKTTELSKLKAQQGWIKNCQFIGYYAADIKGFYREENLELDFAPGGAGISPSTLVDSKQMDIALQSTSIAMPQTNADGANLIAFGTLNQRSPAGLMYIIKHPDGSPGYVIDTPEKCRGQRIGIQGGPTLPWRIICKDSGLDVEKDMEIVNVSFDPTPLIDGTVVGYWCFATSQPQVLTRLGYEVGVLDAYEWGYKVPGDFLLAHKDTFNSDKEKLVGFLRATIRGWVYANSHLDEMVNYVLDNFGEEYGLEYEDQIMQAEAQIAYQTSKLVEDKGLFAMNMEDWENCYKILKDMGEITAEMKVTDYATTEIFDEVYAKGRVDQL